MPANLTIRGGEMVVDGVAVRADVVIEDGLITTIGSAEQDTRGVLDASGCLVLPGGVDPHVHLTPSVTAAGSYPWVDDFTSGTRAAAVGGITTVGNMTVPRPGESMAQACRRVAAQAERESIVDVFLHPVVAETAHLDLAELDELAELGHTSIKIFATMASFERDRGRFFSFMAEAGHRGFAVMVHCEDAALVEHCAATLTEQGMADVAHFGASRPVAAEEAAVVAMAAFAEATGTPVYLVHLSSRRALEAATAARARGAPVHVETRPLYLHLDDHVLSRPDGPVYVGQPPLRASDDVTALWAGMQNGTVDTVGTDHAPWLRAQKMAATASIAELLPGVADLETVRPMLFSEGVLTGRLTLNRFVALTATEPARLFGLLPRKGLIAPGADADLVVWDPTATRAVDGSRGPSRADYSPYDGRDVTGWPVHVLNRGDIVVEDGKVVGSPGRGRVLRRNPATGRHPRRTPSQSAAGE